MKELYDYNRNLRRGAIIAVGIIAFIAYFTKNNLIKSIGFTIVGASLGFLIILSIAFKFILPGKLRLWN